MPLNETNISWTDYTWNPVHGCSKTSEGCALCYAAATSQRFGHTEKEWTIENAEENVTIKPEALSDLDRLPKRSWVFVNSMSDILHPEVPDSFVHRICAKIEEHPESVFQILTKHGPDWDRAKGSWPENVILGVSVESQRRDYRIDWLRDEDAATKFISFEPLVEPIEDVDLTEIDWSIVGGESGGIHPDEYDRRVENGEIIPNEDGSDWSIRRPMDPEWARRLYEIARRDDAAYYFKQHSGPYPEDDIELEINGERQVVREFPDLPGEMVRAPEEYL